MDALCNSQIYQELTLLAWFITTFWENTKDLVVLVQRLISKYLLILQSS